MSSYFDGLAYGLVFILALGPAFFLLFQTAIKQGFTKAMSVSIGVNMTDGLLIALVIVGFGPLMEDPQVKFWLGLIGAIILIAFGVSSWFSKKNLPSDGEPKDGSLFSFWLKGFILNGFNPLIALFWIGIVGTISALGYSSFEQMWFFAGFLTTVLCVDALKVFLITRLAHRITDRFLLIVNRGVAVIFVAFGIRLVVFLAGWG